MLKPKHILYGVLLAVSLVASGLARADLPDFAIVIDRGQPRGDWLPGTLYVNGTEVGPTLENNSLRIEPGEYVGQLRYVSGQGFAQGPFGTMGHRGDFLLEISGVSGRTDLLFHGGNKPMHSEGCVLLGAVLKDKNGVRVVPDDIPLRKLRLLFYGTDVPDGTPAKSISVSIRGPKPPEEQPDNSTNSTESQPSGGAGSGGDQDAATPKHCAQLAKRAVAEKLRLEREAERLDRRAEAMRRKGADFSENDRQLQRIVSELEALPEKAEDKLAPLSHKVAELIAERKKALDELRSGRFCSQCRRPASEIERVEHVSFMEHLGRVQGEPIPVTQEELDAKAAEYDAKIEEAMAAFVQTYQRYIDRDKELRDEYADLITERHKIWKRFRDALAALQQSASDAWDKAQEVFQQLRDKADVCRKETASASPVQPMSARRSCGVA